MEVKGGEGCWWSRGGEWLVGVVTGLGNLREDE